MFEMDKIPCFIDSFPTISSDFSFDYHSSTPIFQSECYMTWDYSQFDNTQSLEQFTQSVDNEDILDLDSLVTTLEQEYVRTPFDCEWEDLSFNYDIDSSSTTFSSSSYFPSPIPDEPINWPAIKIDKQEVESEPLPDVRLAYRQKAKRAKKMRQRGLPESLGSNGERLFLCSYIECGRSYNKGSHLRAHLRRHMGEKPFVCEWTGCRWRFSRSDELARHRRKHSGIKPYPCPLCDKHFARSDHMAKHIRVHSRDKHLAAQLPAIMANRPGPGRKKGSTKANLLAQNSLE